MLQLYPGGLGRVKRKHVDKPLVFQMLGERGVNRRPQVIVADKPLADDIFVDPGNERGLSRFGVASGLVDETDARLVALRRPQIFALGSRDAG